MEAQLLVYFSGSEDAWVTKSIPVPPQKPQASDVSFCDRRIHFFVTLLKGTSLLAGGILAISQIVHIVLDGPNSLALWFGLGLGLITIYFGYKPNLFRFVKTIVLRHSFSDKLAVWLVPLLLFASIVSFQSVVGREAFKRSNTEGGVIEYGTSIAFLLAAIFAVPVARYLWRSGERMLGRVYCILAALLGFVAFEEISWGQKLFGLNSPGFFEANNSQSEITLHNLIWVNELIDPALIVLGLLGTFSWFIFQRMAGSSNRFIRGLYRYFIPSWFISTFFLAVSVVHTCTRYIEAADYTMSIYGESSELLLSLGFLMLVLTGYFRQCIQENSANSA